MRYISLFTGIGGFDLALDRAGHIGLAMVEKDKACQGVLRQRFPNVPLHDDVMVFGRKDVHGTVDIVAGGSPCQAFSVAGLRKSLADERGNLAFEFVRICDELQPQYVIWENVPGVLSTKDNAFGYFLAGLVGEDTPIVPAGGRWTNAGVVVGPARAAAWRVLDAQYFGVAQRRRRVFVVASAASAERSCIEILFEREGVRRDSPPRSQTRESIARTVAEGIRTSHAIAPTLRHNGVGTAKAADSRGQDALIYQWSSGGGDDLKPTAQALRSGAETNYQVVYDARGNGDGEVTSNLRTEHGGIGDYTPVVIEPRYYTRDNKTGGAPSDLASITNSHKAGDSAPVVFQQNAFGDPANRITDYTPIIVKGASIGRKPEAGPQWGEVLDDGTVYTLNATEVHAVAMQQNAIGDPDIANCVETKVRHDYDNQVGTAVVAVRSTGAGFYSESELASVRAQTGGTTYDMIATNATVRRLTPVECERLQAFPDGWTEGQADTPRYKQLGNAVCVNVVEWIVRRI